MEIITIIDKLLQNIIVRWMLAFMFIVLSFATGIQTIRLETAFLQLKAEKGQNAEYAARLTVQSDAIKKANDDMATMQKQAETANKKAAELNKQLQHRKIEIREVILQGTCPDMVQQMLDEVRR